MMFLLILLSAIFRISSCLYENADVVHLNSNNFDKLVTHGTDTWLVQFYSSYCPYCQNFAPSFEKAAKLVKNTVKVGVVDADEDRSLLRRFNVRGIPTVKIYHPNNPIPESYNGPRTSEAIVSKIHSLKSKRKFNEKQENTISDADKTDETDQKNEGY